MDSFAGSCGTDRRRWLRSNRSTLCCSAARPGDPGDDENGLDPLTDAPGEDSSAERELRLDVQRVLLRLPEHLRAVALLLRDMSVAEICQHTGKSRSGINHFIRQIRAAFEEAGLTPERLAKRGDAR